MTTQTLNPDKFDRIRKKRINALTKSSFLTALSFLVGSFVMYQMLFQPNLTPAMVAGLCIAGSSIWLIFSHELAIEHGKPLAIGYLAIAITCVCCAHIFNIGTSFVDWTLASNSKDFTELFALFALCIIGNIVTFLCYYTSHDLD